MICPDCGKLRHPGKECDPVYEDEPDTLETLRIDALMAVARYRSKRNEEHERAR